ncbi:hypothetical protein HNR16_000071 [Pseudoclavibacter chungangensis]|uniref:DUF3375 family protein n=1 Tax=Pseudoclavibacter chungangensis TaxID=587635 RepID=UPI0015CD4460|nr:DUF3375 family protein [Pseudoclavibacter chungangensis]NYJ65283.1 hypothetical protein [Pseudoclavibacter chungangensis]
MPDPASPPDGALRDADVAAVWESDPTWALLRSHNGRWIIPLFSRCLERAVAPVSADWFHQRVAEVLAQLATDRAVEVRREGDDGEDLATRGGAADVADDPTDDRAADDDATDLGAADDERAAHDDEAADDDADDEAEAPGLRDEAADGDRRAGDDPRPDPAAYCRAWVERRWLVRTRAGGPEGRAHYRLSQHALRALRIVRELGAHESAVSEARLGSITHAVRRLADLANPSAEAQLARIDEEIEALRARRAAIETQGPERVAPEAAARQLDEVVRLTSSLPESFRQLSGMVEQRHREVARKASFERIGKGALVDRYLQENDLLEQTPEGRAYRGFAAMLSSRGIDAMREDIGQILEGPFAAELTESQRTRLESLISSLLAEEQEVQESYSRWTSSLRRFLTRSGAEKHHRLLTLTERALEAGDAWVAHRPGRVTVPVDVLGLGGADVRDVSQMQPWRDRGRPSVDVVAATDATTLPNEDRLALRLAAGTSAAAAEATVEHLLATRETVTGADVYAATDPEFRRLGLVLSVLDLAIERDAVHEEGRDRVRVDGTAGTGREVTLPLVVFAREEPDAPAEPDGQPSPGDGATATTGRATSDTPTTDDDARHGPRTQEDPA